MKSFCFRSVALAALMMAGHASAATFVVTATTNSGPGTLRQAIFDANNAGGANAIAFNIPGDGVKTIFVGTALTPFTSAITLDGFTQPGASSNTLATGNNAVMLIEVATTNSSQGLSFAATGGTIRGLVINGFNQGITCSINGPGSIVEGCFIGTDATGTNVSPRANGTGIICQNGANRIGGTNPWQRNVISGSTSYGIYTINGLATNNVILGNYIGTDKTGTQVIPNVTGVHAEAPATVIGGTAPGSRNVISGNTGNGISIYNKNCLVEGNFIGTDATGANALGNNVGVNVCAGCVSNQIGGATLGAGNVISGNNDTGINIAQNDAVTDTIIQGNFIGTDAQGLSAIPNGQGIRLYSHHNVVGGTTAAARNVISGNSGDAIDLLTGNSNTVQGCYLGIDVTGSATLPNGGGLRMQAASYNIIGGSAPGAGNTIGGNISYGIDLLGGNFNQIDGNFIGTDSSGAVDLGNAGDGFGIGGAAGASNYIGSVAANLIAFNAAHGVECGSGVDFTTIEGNRIYSNAFQGVFVSAVRYRLTGNSIFDNAFRGIFLFGSGGFGFNDPCDDDTGSNELQNFPVLASSTSTVNSVTIAGVLDSTPSTAFTLEFFANTVCDPSGFGEGETFIGATNVTTGANCTNNFNVTFPVAVANGLIMTATATDPAGNTSDFSRCITNHGVVTGCRGVAWFDVGSDTILASGQTVIGTACTYEAVIMFPNTCNAGGFVFDELQQNAEDKQFYAGPTFLQGFNAPLPCCLGGSVSLALDVFHHIAYVYDGNEERIYSDGVLVTNRVVGLFDVADASEPLHVGAILFDQFHSTSFIGLLDSLRLSTVARYNGASFTPPTGDMTSDANTVLLYNFNDAPGSTTVADESPLNRTGTLGAGIAGGTSPSLLCLDDGIGFAPTLTLSLALDTNSVGAAHTVTASVKAGTNGIPGVTVNFDVTGANAGISGVSTTAANGSADFTYTGLVAGTDIIRAIGTACLDLTGTATKVWISTNVAPQITCPGNIVTNTAAGSCARSVTFVASATGTPTPVVTYWTNSLVVTSPAGFPKGVTTVTAKASNVVSVAMCTFTVTVNDNVLPVPTCPGNIISNVAAGVTNSIVNYTLNGTDNCPGVSVTGNPPSGSTFGLGTTPVAVTAVDGAANTNTCTFNVTVQTAGPCVITCPADIVSNTSLGVCGATVTFNVGSSGPCPTVIATPASGSFFNEGTNTVTVTTNGVTACTFNVTVIDNEPPSLSCPGTITTNVPAGVTNAIVNFNLTSADDNCSGGSLIIDPPSGTAFPLGTTAVVVSMSDAAGNTNGCSFNVIVLETPPEAHDLALIKMQAPKNVNLKGAEPSLTKFVKVTLQNRSPHDEAITNFTGLVTLVAETLGTNCPNAMVVLHPGPPNNPKTLKPKQKLTVTFDVTWNCANDPLKGAGHEDFRYLAAVHHEAIDGNADTHPEDDGCPRATLSSGVDPNPDPNKPLKDTGCAGGVDVKTDVFRKQ